MFSSSVYFDTDMEVADQLKMFKPLLTLWLGENYLDHYYPAINYFSYRSTDEKFLIAIEANEKYGQGIYDNDNFRYVFHLIDLNDNYTYNENLNRLIGILNLLWENGIPTCTPGKSDELPYKGGEDGPIPWP